MNFERNITYDLTYPPVEYSTLYRVWKTRQGIVFIVSGWQTPFTWSVIASFSLGCDPHIMGIGPVPAIRNLLAKTGYKLDDIDLVEVSDCTCESTFIDFLASLNRRTLTYGSPSLTSKTAAGCCRWSWRGPALILVAF